VLGLRDVCDVVDTWDGGVECWWLASGGVPEGASGSSEVGRCVYGFIGLRDCGGRAKAGCKGRGQ
jgi:hypothetical protein